MADDGGRRGSILISHTHWDHIQGIPFFDPLYVPGNEWHVYGPKGLRESVHEALAGQMEYTYFPVPLDGCAANIHYHDLIEGSFAIDDISVSARYLNHPALTLGYRLRSMEQLWSMPAITSHTRARSVSGTAGSLGRI